MQQTSSEDAADHWAVVVDKILDAETVELIVEQRFATQEQAEDSARFMKGMYRPPAFRIRVISPGT